jgi:hypothetical protein
MTECNQTAFPFEAHFSRRVEAGFDGADMTTDGGALLLHGSENPVANRVTPYQRLSVSVDLKDSKEPLGGCARRSAARWFLRASARMGHPPNLGTL